MSPANTTKNPALSCPSVVVGFQGWKHTVAFTMATLLRLEETCGCGIYEIVDRFRSLRPERRVLDGATLSDELIAALPDKDRDRLEASPEAKQAALRNFKLSHIASFCAGCVGVSVEEFGKKVPPDEVMGVFMALQEPFWLAMTQLNGVEDGADPTTPSAPAPTSGSSSACGPGSLGGSPHETPACSSNN